MKQNIKILVNPTSGNGEGRKFFSLKDGYLVQETDPENMDEQLNQFLEAGDHVIIAGGDGTISHVIQGLYRTGLYKTVSVSFFPLGTGNDLAKSLNIKKQSVKSFSLSNKKFSEVTLNLWKFDRKVFINYLSFGIDAKCLSDVTRWRSYFPKLRWITLKLYALAGFKNLFYRKKMINHQKVVSLIFSNINYYGGGCPLVIHSFSDNPHLNMIVVKTYFQWLILMWSHFTKKPSLTEPVELPFTIENTENLAQADGEMLSFKKGVIEYAGKLKVVLIN
jgi:diacylglycerol kinase family enzyme